MADFAAQTIEIINVHEFRVWIQRKPYGVEFVSIYFGHPNYGGRAPEINMVPHDLLGADKTGAGLARRLAAALMRAADEHEGVNVKEASE